MAAVDSVSGLFAKCNYTSCLTAEVMGGLEEAAEDTVAMATPMGTCNPLALLSSR